MHRLDHMLALSVGYCLLSDEVLLVVAKECSYLRHQQYLKKALFKSEKCKTKKRGKKTTVAAKFTQTTLHDMIFVFVIRTYPPQCRPPIFNPQSCYGEVYSSQ